MSIEEKLVQMLTERGVFEKTAKTILETVKAQDHTGAMQGRWGDDASEYPQEMLAVLWVSVRYATLEWIDANTPKAWYRPMFVD